MTAGGVVKCRNKDGGTQRVHYESSRYDRFVHYATSQQCQSFRNRNDKVNATHFLLPLEVECDVPAFLISTHAFELSVAGSCQTSAVLSSSRTELNSNIGNIRT